MKNKLLNFLLAFIATMLIFNYFFPAKNAPEVQKNGIFLNTQKADYTIPNIPVITLDNSTSKDIKFNTCNNLEIIKDSKKIESIPTNFCKDEIVKANSNYTFNLNPLSKLFFISGQYAFTLKIDNVEYFTSFIESNKGFFNNFFSTIFYAPVYNFFVFLINWLPNHSLGIAIIMVTLLIRILLLVPQHNILVNSKKMNDIQPKIKEIQAKYKGDQSKIGMELLALYKKEGVNPLGSCLPLLIQFPLLIVLYWVISGVSAISNYYYLYTPLKSFDVSLINTNFIGLDLMVIGGITGGILALTIGIAQWLQIKLSLTVHTKSKEKGIIIQKDKSVDDPVSEFMPDPNMMNKFMLWGMPAMLTVTAFFMPTGVGIYWLISTIFTIFQQMVVNKKLNKVKK